MTQGGRALLLQVPEGWLIKNLCFLLVGFTVLEPGSLAAVARAC